jgi:hypothetical protein
MTVWAPRICWPTWRVELRGQKSAQRSSSKITTLIFFRLA